MLSAISNSISIEFGKIDNNSTVQSVSKIISLPVAYTKSYCICVNGQEGKGIPGYNNITLSTFNLLVNGPWGNWPSRWANWLTIGY